MEGLILPLPPRRLLCLVRRSLGPGQTLRGAIWNPPPVWGLFLPSPGGLPRPGRLSLLLIAGWQHQFLSWHCPAGRQSPRASSEGRWSCVEHLLPMWPQPKVVELEQNLSLWRLSNLAASLASLTSPGIINFSPAVLLLGRECR